MPALHVVKYLLTFTNS